MALAWRIVRHHSVLLSLRLMNKLKDKEMPKELWMNESGMGQGAHASERALLGERGGPMVASLAAEPKIEIESGAPRTESRQAREKTR